MRRRTLIAGIAGSPLPAWAQGFAGLGTDADGFRVPVRGMPLTFPKDHGPHPGYRIEWWYLTVTLTGEDGTQYGVQWTLFRSALEPDGRQLWLGHAALTTPDVHLSAERSARGGIGQADVLPPLDAFIDEWHLSTLASGGDAMNHLAVSAGSDTFRFALELMADGPLVAHGDRGFSFKSEAGQASYYYSQPFLRASGEIETTRGRVAVTGEGWLDREWSSQPLAEDQVGWDWFSLVFPDGHRLMAFGLRARDGGHFTSGTWISPDGTPMPLGDGLIQLTSLRTAEVEGRAIPIEWRLEVPSISVDVTVSALNPNCWMDTSIPYWEGPVSFAGSGSGRGYLEMTGYA